MFFATNRAVSDQGRNVANYSDNVLRNQLRYGECEVNIPIDHRIGELKTPFFRSIFTFENSRIAVTNTTPMNKSSFFGEIRAKIGKAPGREVIVFIHGFNTTFEDGIRRTAQLAYDLKFQGAAVSFNWPSYHLSSFQTYILASRLSLVSRLALGSAYSGATENADATARQLRDFLSAVRKGTGATTIHLIAHSIGARVLVSALYELARSESYRGSARFRQVVLAAPDINTPTFEELARIFPSTAERVTLYASSTDKVLRASEMINDHPRAGEGGDSILIVPSVDSIEASAVDTSLDGHGYYAENKSLIFDLFNLLRHGDPPDYRVGLEAKVKTGSKKYWALLR